MPETVFITQRIKRETANEIKKLGTSGDSFHDVLDMVLDAYKQNNNSNQLNVATVGSDGRVRLTHLKGKVIEYREAN